MQFTAAATLLLEQQGKLTVQDPICNYIDPCPEAWKPITLHHLLSHTSGIPNYMGTRAGEALGKSGATTDQILELIRDKPLEYTPGAERVFSHSGFVLLGLVIERASGQSYGDFMRAAVFEPLGMQDSGYGNPTDALAIGYLNSGDRQATFDVSALGASGGLFTTSHASFGDQGEVGSGYGIVLGTLAIMKGHRDTRQGGGPLGYGSCVIYVLDDRTSIIMLGNQDNVDVFAITDALEQIALGIL